MLSSRHALELALLGLVLGAAAFLRLKGIAWDDGYLFHPDERQIVIVASRLAWPTSLLDFFSPSSPLNPQFFAYGSFPIYLLKLLAPLAPATAAVGPWADDRLASLVLFGRALSAFADLGTILLTYALGRRLYSGMVGLVAAAGLAFTVLDIQLSHFYAVDTMLTFLMLTTMYAALRVAETGPPESGGFRIAQKAMRAKKTWIILCGILFGLALATKITAIALIVPVAHASWRAAATPLPVSPPRAALLGWWRSARATLVPICGMAVLVFVLTQPYSLIDWFTFGQDVIREGLVARGWLDFPYTRQFAGTMPFLYQVAQSSVWGLGLPLGLFAWGGLVLAAIRWRRAHTWRDTFLLIFVLFYFASIGVQYAKYMRYVLPLLPALYLVAAQTWLDLLPRSRVIVGIAITVLLVISAAYALAFVGMYDAEHPWLTASRWIYQNVPRGATLAVEEWDDALPTLIAFPGGARRGSEYTQLVLPMYADDTEAKRAALSAALSRSDLVLLASQRLYASIGRLPGRYPLAVRYYQKLFSGELGFEPVMTARRDPVLFGITIRDDPRAGLAFDASSVDARFGATYGRTVWNWGFADESFSVYDHPQPILWRKVRSLSAAELDSILKP